MTLDVRTLPLVRPGSGNPAWWGAAGVVAIEATMFLLVIGSYFYVRLGFSTWPPPGIPMPDVVGPTIGVLILIASCVPAYWASEAAKAGDRGGAIRNMALNLALATVFLVIRIVEWNQLNFNWSAGIYGSLVWFILELHTLDYAAGMLSTIILLGIYISRRTGPMHRAAVEADGLTWYFISAIWIPLYAIIYIAPYVLHA